ncbi:MAG TPA: DUF1800 domain-containing protein [Thermoanaerobaculia bacterium]|nr:DUF1800 domain-containing protein [Thermoanaerobaculia bacterium]
MASVVWNEETAAHLYRRAAFGATPAEIASALRDGLGETVEKLVEYEGVSNAALDSRLARLALDLTNLGGISRWWVTRMTFTARPLEERMTLFWHDHFATAISKVGDAGLMLMQNDLFRRHALGNFVELTVEVSKDVAMLIWLDNFTSVKDHPNENYGRELLELFTLGQGFYSELDVLSAAKAFTGWTISRRTREFIYRDDLHDHSQKDFLGRVGDWNGDDIVRIACGEFAHGQLIARKLFSYFAWENPGSEIVNRFAQIYLDAGNEIKPLVKAILLSDEMYTPEAVWRKVKSPVDHTVIAKRQMLIDDDRASRLAGSAMSAQGQTLFNPPDVDGWSSGLAWISSGSILSRMNLGNSMMLFFDPARFLQGAAFSTAEAMVDVFLKRLGPVVVSDETRSKLIAYVAPDGVLPAGTPLLVKQRGLAHMIVSLPEWQMY